MLLYLLESLLESLLGSLLGSLIDGQPDSRLNTPLEQEVPIEQDDTAAKAAL